MDLKNDARVRAARCLGCSGKLRYRQQGFSFGAGYTCGDRFRHRVLMPEFPKAFGSYNFMIRREAFEAVGGFNASYRRASGEDNDLSYKIIRREGRIFFRRDACVDIIIRNPCSVI